MSTQVDLHDEGRGLSRRSMLTRSAGVGRRPQPAASRASSAPAPRTPASRTGVGRAPQGAAGYGPLVADPAGLLSLPAGFTLHRRRPRRRHDARERREDAVGSRRRRRVRPPRRRRLRARGQPRGQRQRAATPSRRVPGFTYDPALGGGTTTIEVDKDGNRVREYVSLAGTLNNCAGGKSPWGTWLTCEETEGARRRRPSRHGYVFEVDPYDMEANRDPQPIKALGPVRARGARRRPATPARST